MDQWVLLWSQSQNALHIEPLELMLENNRAAYGANRQSDYIPILIGRKEVIDTTALNLQGTLASRDEVRVRRVA